MKIDTSKLKKSSSEVPADCKALIESLKSCSEDELLAELKKVETWTYGKCELYHWVDVLDLFDSILERACHTEHENSWVLACDLPQNKQLKELLLWALHFTTLLVEHSFSRHLYNSMEHLTSMLSSNCLNVVLGVLNLLHMFSKRSNFISRLASERRVSLLSRLTYLAESWPDGKEGGFGLVEACSDSSSINTFSPNSLVVDFIKKLKGDGPRESDSITTVIPEKEWLNKSPAQLMEDLIDLHHVPLDNQMQLFTNIRLAHAFSDYRRRLQCVQARLQALSVLSYCNALADAAPSWFYDDLLEELTDVLATDGPLLVEIRVATLATLTAMIDLARNPYFPTVKDIISALGAHFNDGYLPVLVRSCIASLTGQHTEQDMIPDSLPLASGIFSFLHRLASKEDGQKALAVLGMMPSLLRVVTLPGSEHTVAVVGVIECVVSSNMSAFQAHGGLQIFINRLESEVDACRKKQPYEICPPVSAAAASNAGVNIPGDGAASSSSPTVQPLTEPIPGVTCLPQRAALLKSMLNILKKAIQHSYFSDSVRHVMDGSLPAALKHIISNAEYYGPSLFLLGVDVVTAYVFQEPSLLSSLQDSGLTDVVLHALLVKDVPATREVLGSLPNVFSALCLNARGLASFVACKPFPRLLNWINVLLSPDFLPAMRRRRSSDPMGDIAAYLGNAMNELMRHQPSLRTDATAGIIQLLEELCALDRDPNYISSSRNQKFEVAQNTSARSGPVEAIGGGSSDEEEDEEEEATTSSNLAPPRGIETEAGAVVPSEKTPVPSVDYVLNVMKFANAILSNNSTDNLCREIISQRGLIPLAGILGLPNLPVDFPVTPACQAVAAVCKSIINPAHEPLVVIEGLEHFLNTLQQLHKPLDPPGGSVLLRELASSSNPSEDITSPNATPLLHAIAAAPAYIMMFIHVCRTGQSDIRTLSINHWGSPLGLPVLTGLSKLYMSLVWERTLLLALCSDETLPLECQFGLADLEKLLPTELKTVAEGPSCSGAVGMELGINSVAAALQARSSEVSPQPAMEFDHDQLDAKDIPRSEKLTPAQQHQMKMVKPLLSTASRVCRALAELFGLLFKLCVGSPIRHMSAHQVPPTPLIPAQAVAGALTMLLTNVLAWEPPVTSPTPKFRLTFLICSVGFTSPMLFDEKKMPYHLMLHKFVSCGGQAAFFDAFYWALSTGGRVAPDQGLVYPDLPGGTAEFLDAWLMLLEKMVNPKNILDSPHQLPNKALHGSKHPFSPLKYLISTHRQAFDAIMKLWGERPLKVYGARMTESVVTILCHILKGDVIIQEKLALEKVEEPAGTTTASTSGSTVNLTPAIPAQKTSSFQGAPLSKKEVKEFVQQALIGCLLLLDALPETVCRVFRISELVGKETSALEFLIDNLWPSCKTTEDNGPALICALFASLMSSSREPKAQRCLVAEVKGALKRMEALTMPESNDKHNRLQSLTALLSTIIESCPELDQHSRCDDDPLGLSESDSEESDGAGERLGTALLNKQDQMGRIRVAPDISPGSVPTPTAIYNPIAALKKVISRIIDKREKTPTLSKIFINRRVNSLFSVSGKRYECEVTSIRNGPRDFYIKIIDGNENLRFSSQVCISGIDDIASHPLLNELFNFQVRLGGLEVEVIQIKNQVPEVMLYDCSGKSILEFLMKNLKPQDPVESEEIPPKSNENKSIFDI